MEDKVNKEIGEISEKEVEETYEKLKAEVESKGYFLNLDSEFTMSLIRGLLKNGRRYGYWACPCRLASGSREKDIDVICPCYYRDDDLNEYGCCYCALYVSKKNKEKKEFKPIPERRNQKTNQEYKSNQEGVEDMDKSKMEMPIWRCKVCGYLCSRENAPDVCPICGAEHDRFERFEL